MIEAAITTELRRLRQAFQRHDRDVKLVGGAVRSLMLNEMPSDIDLCTDADPDEQQAIYEAENFKHFPTGVRYGTWTVLLDDRTPVEITSLRSEVEHGGSQWTRDWQEDLSRRDLTINAMALSFDGELLDPFGGVADLERRIVRFVGDPAQRVQENYLRVLRFFRFHAQIAGDAAYDTETLAVVVGHASGLQATAPERIWHEIALIVAGRYGVKTLYDLIDLDIAPHIGLPTERKQYLDPDAELQNTCDPVSLMAAHIVDREAVLQQAQQWRWSTDEREQAVFIADVLRQYPALTLEQTQRAVARGAIKYRLAEALRVLGNPTAADALTCWQVPDFPVFGKDLLACGLSEGREIGQILRALYDAWDRSDFRLSKTELLNLVPTVRST